MALFIDGANLYAAARTLGFDIDFKRLQTEFRSRGTLVRAFYYTVVIEDREFSSLRPLLDWLDYNGFTVVTKPAKEFDDGEGRRRFKRSMGVELAVGPRLSRPCASCAAPGRARYRRVHNGKPATEYRRRTPSPGRRLYRLDGVAAEDPPRRANRGSADLTLQKIIGSPASTDVRRSVRSPASATWPDTWLSISAPRKGLRVLTATSFLFL